MIIRTGDRSSPPATGLLPATTPKGSLMSSTHGSLAFPFTAMVRDTIETHGLEWAVSYYFKRLPASEARFFIRAALAI